MEDKYSDDDIQFISERVSQGFTSGRFTSSEGKKEVVWSLTIEVLEE